jgi:hypothetical protein
LLLLSPKAPLAAKSGPDLALFKIFMPTFFGAGRMFGRRTTISAVDILFLFFVFYLYVPI